MAERAKAFLDTYSEVDYLDGGVEFDPALSLGSCYQYPYGYLGSSVTPCIFLTFNNIDDWEPEPITEEDFDERSFPFSDIFRTHWESQSNKEQIFVDCSSEHDSWSDQYFPATRGFESKFFPIQEGLNIPVVAIQISQLVPGKHDFTCRAYYKGVKFSAGDQYNSVVTFTLEMLAAK